MQAVMLSVNLSLWLSPFEPLHWVRHCHPGTVWGGTKSAIISIVVAVLISGGVLTSPTGLHALHAKFRLGTLFQSQFTACAVGVVGVPGGDV